MSSVATFIKNFNFSQEHSKSSSFQNITFSGALNCFYVSVCGVIIAELINCVIKYGSVIINSAAFAFYFILVSENVSQVKLAQLQSGMFWFD